MFNKMLLLYHIDMHRRNFAKVRNADIVINNAQDDDNNTASSSCNQFLLLQQKYLSTK